MHPFFLHKCFCIFFSLSYLGAYHDEFTIIFLCAIWIALLSTHMLTIWIALVCSWHFNFTLSNQLWDNIELFFRTRNNIAAILNEYVDILNTVMLLHLILGHILFHLSNILSCENAYFNLCSMREMPGIMSHMPPLPVSMNEELANSIFTNTSQVISHAESLILANFHIHVCGGFFFIFHNKITVVPHPCIWAYPLNDWCPHWLSYLWYFFYCFMFSFCFLGFLVF